MTLDIVRADLFFERHVDTLDNRFNAFLAGMLEVRLGSAFSQRACLFPGNHGLNL